MDLQTPMGRAAEYAQSHFQHTFFSQISYSFPKGCATLTTPF